MASVTSRLMTPAPGPSQQARKGLFSQIRSSREHKPPRIVLYGVQGVGKTTWASKAPNPIFLPTENGLENLDVKAFPLATEWADVQEAIESLVREEHEYQTFVIDSLDRLELLIWQDVCQEYKLKNIEDAGYAKGYVYALSRWQWLLQALDALRDLKQMAVILIAHAKIERYEAPESESYDRYGIRIHKHAAAVVQEWADHVLFCTYEVFVRSEKLGFGKEKGKAIGQGERIMRTSERPFASAKNRIGLPDELPLDWEQFARYLTASINAAKNGKDSSHG